MRSTMRGVLCACVLVLSASAAAEAERGSLTKGDLDAIRTPTFMQYHPDLRWRLSALAELERGEHEIAFKQFQRAALYADKVSQAMVAEMHWEGVGTQRDRPLAYAWMDLAAERAYPPLLGKREELWAALSETERKQALVVGRAVYAEFGDEVAVPRLERALKQGRRTMTGSRGRNSLGVRAIFPGSNADRVQITSLNPKIASPEAIAGGAASAPTIGLGGIRMQFFGGVEVRRLWAKEFWDTEQYLAWKDLEIDTEITGPGRVDVLPLQVVNDERR